MSMTTRTGKAAALCSGRSEEDHLSGDGNRIHGSVDASLTLAQLRCFRARSQVPRAFLRACLIRTGCSSFASPRRETRGFGSFVSALFSTTRRRQLQGCFSPYQRASLSANKNKQRSSQSSTVPTCLAAERPDMQMQIIKWTCFVSTR